MLPYLVNVYANPKSGCNYDRLAQTKKNHLKFVILDGLKGKLCQILWANLYIIMIK